MSPDRYDHEGKAWMAAAGLSGVAAGAVMPEQALVIGGVWAVILLTNLILLWRRAR
jgi:hypothetical protein